MPVNLTIPSTLAPIAGIQLRAAEAGIKKAHRKDFLVMSLDQGSVVAGVFTQNHFCAAPVQISKKHLATGGPIRALVINTGNANAGTGERGVQQALAVCQAVASALDCAVEQVLPFSTGVILELLPADRIIDALPQCVDVDWVAAAETIMTTDTVPKGASRIIDVDGHCLSVTGIAKGAGMIHPNMATMLGFIATDVAFSQPILDQLVREIADASFNCISIDGDTSTNDSFMLISTGASTLPPITTIAHPAYHSVKTALMDVALELAQAIVRDGEGVTKFITVKVEEGRSYAECKTVAYAIARSPLVKTAFFASDPNLGRLLCAIGYSAIEDLDVSHIDLYLDDLLVVSQGERCLDYQEALAFKIMQQDEIGIRVVLHRGTAYATVWTCDFSYDYVKINAEYRS